MPGLALLFALFALRSCEGAANSALRALPCPDPEDIYPCVCTVDPEKHMTMDCSHVASEDELARVFSSNLPFTKFHLLMINGNQNLRVLREGDLGPASFEIIRIMFSVLEEVQDGALAGSYTTADAIVLIDNPLSVWPFHELPLFTSLSLLELYGGALIAIPALRSGSLQKILLGYNQIDGIAADCFHGLENILHIDVHGNNVETILPETFATLPLLSYVSLLGNSLGSIHRGAIALSSTRDGIVDLHLNAISSIEIDAITGLNAGQLRLAGNSLSVLEEEVFRPILEGGAVVTLSDNPLRCGCDVAWLVTDPALLALAREATCSDGEALENLDPSIFEDLC